MLVLYSLHVLAYLINRGSHGLGRSPAFESGEKLLMVKNILNALIGHYFRIRVYYKVGGNNFKCIAVFRGDIYFCWGQDFDG
jgi:hypothetical protein